MRGDTNICNISGRISGEVKVKEKDGKKFCSFTILNKFQLMQKSKEIEGTFSVFAFGDDNIQLCEKHLSEGDYVSVSGSLNQRKDEKSGKILVSIFASHIRKESGNSKPQKEDSNDDDDFF